jgi:hypothetical protein
VDSGEHRVIDPVRFAEAEKEPGLVGGRTASLLTTPKARPCAARSLEYAITDVEIAFREFIYTRYAGPRLLDHVSSVEPTVDVHVPFTPALGLQISPKAFPYFEGTGCIYLREGGESDRVFLLTGVSSNTFNFSPRLS